MSNRRKPKSAVPLHGNPLAQPRRYRPSADELRRAKHQVREHVGQGGLLVRAVTA